MYDNPLAKFLAKLRIDSNETTAEMARRLDISMSSCYQYSEGYKPIPDRILADISAKYNLTPLERERLIQAACFNAGYVKFNIKASSLIIKKMVLGLSNEFNRITEDQAGKILEIIYGEHHRALDSSDPAD